MLPRRAILSLPAAVLSESPCDAWPLWPAAARRLITPEGRVLDFSSGNRTTSEGQA
ncbi:MAG TPA: cellulase, partial [Solibacterales bacterium]|nr:cellulase [Bryobacterales bacterium]